ncbi:unnamed protein product [Boreogadus saida]
MKSILKHDIEEKGMVAVCRTAQPAALLPPPGTLDYQPVPGHPGLVMPQGVVPQAADGPRDTALDTSPPETPEDLFLESSRENTRILSDIQAVIQAVIQDS